MVMHYSSNREIIYMAEAVCRCDQVENLEMDLGGQKCNHKGPYEEKRDGRVRTLTKKTENRVMGLLAGGQDCQGMRAASRSCNSKGTKPLILAH